MGQGIVEKDVGKG